MTDTPMTAPPKLERCPFRHEGIELLEGSWAAQHKYWVYCPCGAMGPISDSPEKARSRWNARLSQPSAPGVDAEPRIVGDEVLWQASYETMRQIATFLWDRLDAIDTTSDMVKDNDKAYRERVERIQKRRFEVATSNGYTLEFLPPPSGKHE